MSDTLDQYRRIMAMDSINFHTCFYCGCISAGFDFVPLIKLASYFLRTGEEADFFEVPACNECLAFAKHDKSPTLELRVDAVKKKLAKKYDKAIHVYQLWDKDEIEEFDYNFKTSLNAGIELGEESYARVKYKGFSFEVDGQKRRSLYVEAEKLRVFGEAFDDFTTALDYASKTYRIPKAKLKALFAEYSNNFDDAIHAFHQQIQRREFDKKCREFAKKYKQNPNFVIRTVKLYMKADQDLSVSMALEKLYEKYIMSSIS